MIAYLLSLLVVLLIEQPNNVSSEVKTVELSNTLTQNLKSNINQVNYKLYISLPNDYFSTTNKYPVVFLLDADYSFALAKQIGEHLSDRNRIQKVFLWV